MSDSSRTIGSVRRVVPVADLRAGYMALSRPLQRAIRNVLESGSYILGENVAEFEKEFASVCGARYGIGVASGTDALTLSLMALGIRSGDEVITVANTASPTVMAILNAGATPVLIDPSPATLLMEVGRLRKVVSRKTKGIVPVHLYGNPCEMESIAEFSAERNLFVVEDCAQSHGASFKRRPLGSFGDVGCYSFYPTKNLGAFGDGGMVVTNSLALAGRLRSLRVYGMGDAYCSLERGLCSRLDEVQAAALRIKLKSLRSNNIRRRRNASWYRDLLSATVGIRFQEETHGGKHVYHQFVVMIDHRDAIRKTLAMDGIGTGVHYPVAICDQPAFKKYSLKQGPYPVSRSLARTILSLPIYPSLQYEDIAYVSSRLIKAVKSFT